MKILITMENMNKDVLKNKVSVAKPIIKKEDEVLKELKKYLSSNEEKKEEKIEENWVNKMGKRGKRLKDD